MAASLVEMLQPLLLTQDLEGVLRTMQVHTFFVLVHIWGQLGSDDGPVATTRLSFRGLLDPLLIISMCNV